MGIGHIPYGYRIIDGKAMADEQEVKNLHKMYEGYLAGLSLVMAAKEAGIECYHTSAAKILGNEKYLGDDYYPQIVSKELFVEAKQERERRAVKWGRTNLKKEKCVPKSEMTFRMCNVIQKYADPFRQAEYAYSLIESEEEV